MNPRNAHILIVMLVAGFLPRAYAGGTGFRAAVVKVDVTPTNEQALMGYAPRRSIGVNDRLHHRILALDDGKTKLFLISSEFGAISPSYYDKVVGTLARDHGIDPAGVWWTVTHTHSAPQLGPPGLVAAFLGERFLKPFDAEYVAMVERRLINGILEARDSLKPARLGVGWGHSSANMNRRAQLSDGRVTLGMDPDGPVDRRIGILRLEKADGSLLALVANYPIHGTVMGSGNLLVSGDVTGIVSDYVERRTGAPMLFINGAAGNLAPLYSGYANAKGPEMTQFEVLLGDRILAANSSIGGTTMDVTLRLDTSIVETRVRDGLTWPGELESYVRTAEGGDQFVKVPLRFLQINRDVAIWSAPLELFCEISNEIRDRSPFPYTFYFGYANGWLGYLPTTAEFRRGGYETAITPFTPVAGDDVSNAVLEGLRSIGK